MAGLRLHDRVLVLRIEAEERTAAGVIIPDTAKEKPAEGEVLAVGPGGRDQTGKVPIDVKADEIIPSLSSRTGDVVVINRSGPAY